MNQVVITGVGVVSPIGNCASEFASSLKAGTVGLSVLDRFGTEHENDSRHAFQLRNFIPLKHTKILDPFIQYIFHATDEALRDSGIDCEQVDKQRLGIAVSSSKGGMSTLEKYYDRFRKRPSALLGARVYTNLIPNIAAQWIARHWKISGPAKPSVAACATGLFSIMQGVRMIEQDEVDYCIAGAGDASITRLMVAGYDQMGVLARDEMRPFDVRRSGFLLGEGAGIVILEKRESARARGANIYGRVLGHAYGFEDSHAYAFSAQGTGLSRCLQTLVRQCNISPKEIDYLNLHGTATKQGDLYETAQIKSAFGKDAHRISTSSTKSMVGHMLGASGAVEVIACLLSIRDGFIPPTANLEQADPECDLDYTPREAKSKKVNTACSLSMGFGGQLGAILLAP